MIITRHFTQETSDGVCAKENGKVLLDDKETRGGKETDDQLNAEENEQVHDDYKEYPVKETDDQPSSEKDKNIIDIKKRYLEDGTRETLKNPGESYEGEFESGQIQTTLK